MDYEKKYNEALKWMRELYPGLHGATKEDAEHFFPELRESEDERVIRTLYYLVRDHDWVNGATKGEALAWLEKQKERKPAEWSEEDNRMIGRVRGIIERYAFTQNAVDVNGELCEKEYVEMDTWLKSLRSQPQWKPSEDQMDALKELIDDANRAGWVTPGATDLYEQLKKLM